MSLQRDIANGRPSELEEQIGVVVRNARERGVGAPVNTFKYNSPLPGERLPRGKIDPSGNYRGIFHRRILLVDASGSIELLGRRCAKQTYDTA